MPQQKLLTYRAYARHRGCALSTVQLAIKSGRIDDAVMEVEGKKLISVDLADKLWLENTDLSQVRGKDYGLDPDKKKRAKKQKQEAEDNEQKGPNYQQNRAIREAYAARMAKLNFEKQSGRLLETKKVEEYIFKIHSRARNSLLNLPDKLGPKLASETDINKILDILNREIEAVCNHFSKGEIDL